MNKIKLVLSARGKNGESVRITETQPKEIDDVLFEGTGGTRTYIDIPDISMFSDEARISIDVYRVHEAEL